MDTFFLLPQKLLQFAVSAFSCFTARKLIHILPDHDVPRPNRAVAATATIESKSIHVLVHDLLCYKNCFFTLR